MGNDKGEKRNLANQRVRVGFKGDFGRFRRIKGEILGWKGDFAKGKKGVKWRVL